jgi:hypothetical protein
MSKRLMRTVTPSTPECASWANSHIERWITNITEIYELYNSYCNECSDKSYCNECSDKSYCNDCSAFLQKPKLTKKCTKKNICFVNYFVEQMEKLEKLCWRRFSISHGTYTIREIRKYCCEGDNCKCNESFLHKVIYETMFSGNNVYSSLFVEFYDIWDAHHDFEFINSESLGGFRENFHCTFMESKNRFFELDGFDIFGYDSAGYDRNGFDIFGFDRDGNHCCQSDFRTQYGYDEDGFDSLGYTYISIESPLRKNYVFLSNDDIESFSSIPDKEVCELINHYHKSSDSILKKHISRKMKKVHCTESRMSDDCFTYDHNNYKFNKYGWTKDGHNKQGRDLCGNDRDGYNEKGFNVYGYDMQGWNKYGYNEDGFDKDGFDEQGRSKDGRYKQKIKVYGNNESENNCDSDSDFNY